MRTIATCFFFFCFSLIFADSFFELPPSWVIEVEIPDVQNLSPSDETEKRYLLYNRQVHPDSKEQFQQFVFQILNQNSAHDDSQIEIEFSPDFETLSLHELCIYRNGQKIDKKDSSRIQVIQRELGLESHFLNGRRSLVALVDDVRIGDVLSYSYTLQGMQPAYKEHFFLTHFTASGYPIERNYLRAVLPKGKTVFVKHYADNSFSEKKIASGNEWIFDISAVDRIHYENDAPFWFLQSSFFTLSDFKDWGEVAALFAPYYYVPKTEIKKLHTLASSLTKDCFTPNKQALKLLQFVQQEIRYFGLEMDVNAFYPASPTEVLKQRHGDCKDKTLLLHALLKSIGISSTPVLVSSYLKDNTLEELPSPLAFNHVILSIHIDSEDYFVDPTLALQGGTLKSLYFPSYSYGLPLGKKSNTLISLPLYQPPKTNVDVETTYKMETNDQLLIESTTTYRGVEADYFRDLLSNQGKASLAENFSSFYEQNYGDISHSELNVQDDLMANELIFSEVYTIERTESIGEPLPIYPLSLQSYLMQHVDLKRNTPLFQNHPQNIREKITFSAPISFPSSKKNQTFDHPWGHFAYSAKSHQNTFSLECFYQSKKDHILPDQLSDFRYYIKSLSNEVPHELTLPSFQSPIKQEKRSYPYLAYIFIGLAFSILSFAIKWHFTKTQLEKQLWKRKLSLMKKQ